MDEKHLSVKREREAKVEEYLEALNNATIAFDNEWEKIEKGHADLEAKKAALAKENGVSSVSDSDILHINAGGQIFRVARGTLTQIKGSQLEALFSGRWEKKLTRDSQGRIFLDINPVCFRSIVDYLNEFDIAAPDNPSNLPTVDPDNQALLHVLLTVFGLEQKCDLDSRIVTDPKHMRAITRFLSEDGHDTGLMLLYRGSRDGLSANSFHQKCDDQGPTVTVVKSSEGYVFGGFAEKPWKSKGDYIRAPKSFLFGLTCHGGKEPVKMAQKRTDTSIYCTSHKGPTFGGGHDLAALGESSTTHLGFTYESPPGSSKWYFTGSRGYIVSEIEVFRIDSGGRCPDIPVEPKLQIVTADGFPEDVCLRFKAEEEALLEALKTLLVQKDAFEKEQIAVQHFFGVCNDKVALLNVSGCPMAVKHSTLAIYKDSVLFKSFVDKNWNPPTKEKRAFDWSTTEVAAWVKEIQGLTEDVFCHFQDVTGPELVAMDREDIRGLGIKRPGSVAIIAKAIQKLCEEELEDSAMVVKHNGYCFGKIIDHLRLKALGCLDVRDPAPPEIREPDQNRFKQTVEYYFPKSAKDFLG